MFLCAQLPLYFSCYENIAANIKWSVTVVVGTEKKQQNKKYDNISKIWKLEIAAGPESLKLNCHKKPHIEQLVHRLLARCHFTVPKKLGSAVSEARPDCSTVGLRALWGAAVDCITVTACLFILMPTSQVTSPNTV